MNTPSRLVMVMAATGLLVILLHSSLVLAEGASPAYAKCMKTKDDPPKKCESISKAAEAAANMSAAQAGEALKKAGAGQSGMGGGLNNETMKAAEIFKKAGSDCKAEKDKCEKNCDPKAPLTAQEKGEVEQAKSKCEKDTQKTMDQLKQGENANKKAGGESKDVQKESSARPQQQPQQQAQQQQQPQQQQQSPQQSPQGGGAQSPQQNQAQNDQQKTADPTQPIRPDEQGAAAGELNCSGSAPLTAAQKAACDAAKPQLLSNGQCPPGTGTNECNAMKVASFCGGDGNSGGANSACPSCKGVTAQGLKAMSVSELQPMCTGSCTGDPALGPNLADACRKVVAGATGASTVAAGAAGFGAASASGSGGGSSAAGGAAGNPSLVDENSLRQLAEQQGSREGQSLGGADPGGGFGGYGGGSSGSEDGGSSGRGVGSLGTQSVGGAGGGGVVANATDIERQFGLSVVNIVSNVLRNRCAQGRFLHCEGSRP